MPTTIKINGAFDVKALRRSMELLTIAHPSLRTVVDFTRVQQRVVSEADAASCFELREVAAADMATAINIIEKDSIRAFDLAGLIVWRATLVSLQDGVEGASESGVKLLMLNQHHLGSDGGSRTVMRQQLLRTYRAVLLGLPNPLPTFPFTYPQWAQWQRISLEDHGGMEEQLEYWKTELADLQGLELPLDKTRPQVLSNRGAKLKLKIDPAKAAAFREQLKTIGSHLTPFTGCLALFMVMLSRYMGKDGFAVGVAMANRGHEGMKEMIGCK